jgi:aminoglycoside phosphotransferase (APT) family kinase protein
LFPEPRVLNRSSLRSSAVPVNDMPAAEVHIDVALARALLEDQHPDLAHLELREFANGWDNVTFRLGEQLVIRMPRRAMAAPLIDHEQRWLPALAPSLPLPIPAPVRNGRPGRGYPWSWSVCPWLPGLPAYDAPPDDFVAAARQLGGFIRALHVPVPEGVPGSPYRGGPLLDRDPATRDRIVQLDELIDGPTVLARWEMYLAVPGWRGPGLWMHGDLHPLNVLVAGGEFSAVIDFGDIAAGDPATDLSCAWIMFPAEVRAVLRDAAGDIDDDTWRRARGWALALSLAYIANSANHPQLADIGTRALSAVLADADDD